MVYVKRNKQGRICAIYNEESDEAKEQLSVDDGEVSEFLLQLDNQNKWEFIKSDLDLIRVIEDLIEILIKERIIAITDFPPEAIEKLLARKRIRNQLSDATGFIDNNDSESLI